MMMTIEFVLWDETLQGKENDAERAEILRYAERALNKTWRDYHFGEGVKIVERGWCCFTAQIADPTNVFWKDTPYTFTGRFSDRLNHLHRLFKGNDLFEVTWYWG